MIEDTVLRVHFVIPAKRRRKPSGEPQPSAKLLLLPPSSEMTNGLYHRRDARPIRSTQAASAAHVGIVESAQRPCGRLGRPG